MKFPLRYVVLHHTGIEQPHYDLMLEVAEKSELATWRLPHWPPMPLDEFTPLAMHRNIYMDYEGPVSGNRGTVSRIVLGSYRVVEDSPACLIIALDDGVRIALPKNTN